MADIQPPAPMAPAEQHRQAVETGTGAWTLIQYVVSGPRLPQTIKAELVVGAIAYPDDIERLRAELHHRETLAWLATIGGGQDVDIPSALGLVKVAVVSFSSPHPHDVLAAQRARAMAAAPRQVPTPPPAPEPVTGPAGGQEAPPSVN